MKFHYVFISRDNGTFAGRETFYNWSTTSRGALSERADLIRHGCACGAVVRVPVPERIKRSRK